jgi:hypothetical protein
MTELEFSNGFDTLLNSYGSAAGFGDSSGMQTIQLDEYEKSFFLTKAQEEIVESLYNGRNPFSESYEQTEELRRYLSSLMCDVTLEPLSSRSSTVGGLTVKRFTFPDGLWFITYEEVTLSSDDECLNGKVLDVVPVTHDEFLRIRRNPFRGCNNHRALRLDIDKSTVEIACKYDIAKYYARYLRRPAPIVLAVLSGDLSVDSETSRTPCELHEALHQKILDRAVILALQSRGALNSKDSK